MEVPRLKLNNGVEMPIIGLGTSQVPTPGEMEAAVDQALRLGYRHFDTAYLYKNEQSLGRVFQRWMDEGRIKREELFVVSKLPWIGMDPARVAYFLELSLNALKLDYVDLYLIHWPVAVKYVDDITFFPKGESGELLVDNESSLEAIWKAMEEQVYNNKVKAIGLSNFNEKQIERIVKASRIFPANLQIELHLYFQQVSLRQACEKYGIAVTAFGPLGSPGRANNQFFSSKFVSPNVLMDENVLEIARKMSKPPAAVLLRFLTQMGLTVIPKSTSVIRMKENLESIGFDLTPGDMEKLKKLDKGEEGRAFGSFPGSEFHKDCPFFPRVYVCENETSGDARN